MEEIIIEDKEKFLKENYMFENVPLLTDKMYCIHCDQVITVGDYKVFKRGDGYYRICCPNAPECNGGVIDWIPENPK